MTFQELQEANKTIATTDIKGKDYAEVNQRIKAFRMIFPNGGIVTDLISNENGICVFRAIVVDENGTTLGTGTAYEKEGSTFINKTSYIENCETSAVGRALAMCGFGIDTSIASAEEVTNAINNQNQEEKKVADSKQKKAVEEANAKAKVLAYVNRHNMSKENIEKLCNHYGIRSLSEMNLQMCEHYIKALEKKGGNINE